MEAVVWEIAISATAVIFSLWMTCYCQLKALHRIEEQLHELVRLNGGVD